MNKLSFTKTNFKKEFLKKKKIIKFNGSVKWENNANFEIYAQNQCKSDCGEREQRDLNEYEERE